MKQMRLFQDIDIGEKKAVNVATVPLRSPFRYPGGKTWFVPYVRAWLRTLKLKTDLVEPFAGGGIIGLTAAFENLAKQVTMVELDDDVAAVWSTILGPQAKWLAEQIGSFEFSHKHIKAVLRSISTSPRERAFVTILRNRLNRGGILAAGAGMVKSGENGKGLRSRWYPDTLRKRIMDIHELRQRIHFVHGDGLEIMEQHCHRKSVAFFVDPPYTVAGRRLYRCSQIDHQRLFNFMTRVRGEFLMTYDAAPEIEELAQRHHFEVDRILMKTTHHRKKYELLIGRDLDWFRDLELP